MNITSFKEGIVRQAGKSAFLLKKHSPEILVTVGVVGVVASAVMASRATLSLQSVTERHHDNIDAINEYVAENQIEDGSAVARAKGDVYVRTGLELGKLYGPAVTVGVASIACILSAHGIMRQRNATLLAAYTVLEKSFTAYRARVVEEYGEEKDRDYIHGLVTRQEVNEKGETVTVTDIHHSNDTPSIYARFFDEYNINWEQFPDKNLFFLHQQQNWLNDRLKARGHVFLNEVYDAIGLEHSQAGALVGWIYDPKDETIDNMIDFGIWDLYNDQSRMFVNGLEQSILLDFNVDGIIWNKIGYHAERPR